MITLARLELAVCIQIFWRNNIFHSIFKVFFDFSFQNIYIQKGGRTIDTFHPATPREHLSAVIKILFWTNQKEKKIKNSW